MSTKTHLVRTPQQTLLQFELASVSQRIFAFVLDIFILLCITGSILLFYPLSDDNIFVYWLLGFIWFAYHPFSELFLNGASLGKHLIGIRIISLSQKPLSFEQSIMRYLVKFIDITLTLGILSIILIIGTQNSQRLGDILADTLVIRKRPLLDFNLNELEKIYDYEMEIQYANVKNMKEEDMVFLKHLVYSETDYSEKVYCELLANSKEKLENILGVKAKESSDKEFLQRIIKEYILLTR